MASKNFSKTLKDIRKKAGFSQKEVYEHFDIPQSTFSSWENGISEPSGEMLIELCKFYKADMLSEFEQDGNGVSYEEWQLIQKYRSISESNPNGRELIDQTINLVYTQTVENNKSAKRTPPPRPNRCFGIWEHKRKHPYRHSGRDGIIVRFPIAN